MNREEESKREGQLEFFDLKVAKYPIELFGRGPGEVVIPIGDGLTSDYELPEMFFELCRSTRFVEYKLGEEE